MRNGVGPSVHAANRGFDSVLGLQRHVYGLLAYAVSVERAWALEMMSELSAVDWPTFDGVAIRK
jgi:RNA-directed DNA polymerase